MMTEIYNMFEEFGIDLNLYDIKASKLSDVCDSLQFIALVCEFESRYNIYIAEDVLDYTSNMISVNMKNVAGASGGGEDKKLKKNCEFILVSV